MFIVGIDILKMYVSRLAKIWNVYAFSRNCKNILVKSLWLTTVPLNVIRTVIHGKCTQIILCYYTPKLIYHKAILSFKYLFQLT